MTPCAPTEGRKRDLFLSKAPPALCVAGVLWLALAVVVTTITGDLMRLAELPWLWGGPILLGLSLAAYLIRLAAADMPAKTRLALALLHFGLLAALAGFTLNHYFGLKGFVYIREGDTASFYVDDDDAEHPLEFSLTLKNFRVSVYPGSLRAADYESDLEIVGTEGTVARKLTVNGAVEFEGYRLYQQDYGLTAGVNPVVRLCAGSADEPCRERFSVKPGEAFALSTGQTVVVADFIPTAVLREGVLKGIRTDGMLSPAFLVEVYGDDGAAQRRWVLPSQPETEDFGALRIRPEDFYGIEYTVLSLVRSPFDGLIYLGFLTVGLGCAGLFKTYFRRRA